MQHTNTNEGTPVVHLLQLFQLFHVRRQLFDEVFGELDWVHCTVTLAECFRGHSNSCPSCLHLLLLFVTCAGRGKELEHLDVRVLWKCYQGFCDDVQ